MTTLSHNEFDDNDHTGTSLPAEEHSYLEADTVNDSGFFGEDETDVAVSDPAVVPDYDEPAEGATAVPDAGYAGEDRGADASDTVVPEALGEHHPGESVGEWLRNDWEQTKQDLHLGGKDKD